MPDGNNKSLRHSYRPYSPHHELALELDEAAGKVYPGAKKTRLYTRRDLLLLQLLERLGPVALGDVLAQADTSTGCVDALIAALSGAATPVKPRGKK